MRDEDIRQATLRILAEIAPEARLSEIRPDVPFRDQMDIDSIDFLNFVVALGEELQSDIPEGDHLQLSTLDSCVAYFASKSTS